MTNEWMKDETLQGIDPFKLEFLQTLVLEGRNLRRDALLPFLMAAARQSREKQISFTKEETALIVAVLKKTASPEELTRIEDYIKKSRAL